MTACDIESPVVSMGNHIKRPATTAIVRIQEPTEPKRTEPPVDGTVYYVKVGGSHIKIGWTSDLAKRMRKYPPNTELLGTHPGSRADELRLHRRFAVHRSHGREWYPLVPVLLDHIKRVVAEHGAPDAATFAAKPTEVPTPRDKQPVKVRGAGAYPIF